MNTSPESFELSMGGDTAQTLEPEIIEPPQFTLVKEEICATFHDKPVTVKSMPRFPTDPEQLKAKLQPYFPRTYRKHVEECLSPNVLRYIAKSIENGLFGESDRKIDLLPPVNKKRFRLQWAFPWLGKDSTLGLVEMDASFFQQHAEPFMKLLKDTPDHQEMPRGVLLGLFQDLLAQKVEPTVALVTKTVKMFDRTIFPHRDSAIDYDTANNVANYFARTLRLVERLNPQFTTMDVTHLINDQRLYLLHGKNQKALAGLLNDVLISYRANPQGSCEYEQITRHS